MSDPKDDEALNDFRETQDTDYEPDQVVHDPDDVPVVDDGEADLLPDDDRLVPLDGDDPDDDLV